MNLGDVIIILLQNSLVVAVPLMIVALGGVFSERSGIINLGLEGEMIFGAFVATIFAVIFQKNGTFISSDPDKLVFLQQLMFVILLVIAAISGAAFSLLLSFSAIKLRADQTIGGTALNMLAPAIVCTFGLLFFNGERFSPKPKPNFIFQNSDLKGVWAVLFGNMYISTYICIAIFIILSIWLYKSKVGTHMRACGEHPQAADSVGINVHKMRYLGTTISGALAGLGGYAYVAACKTSACESTIAGLGFLALAIMIFGNWNPILIFFGALLFGVLNNIGTVSGSIPFLKSLGLSIYFYDMLPYIIVLIVLVVSHNKSGCPKAEGIPYDKGQR